MRNKLIWTTRQLLQLGGKKKKRKNRKKEVEKSFGQVNNQQKKVARQGKEKSDFY
jgi:hypothetical protein